MPRIEATWTGRSTPPTEDELADPIAQLGAEYIGLLRAAHATFQPWEPTQEERQKVEDAVARIKAAVPEISEDALRKMLFDNPNANRKWTIGGKAPYDISEFHILAMNWNNDVLRGNRQVAEQHYGVTQVEVDFLTRGAMILPPAPPLFLSVWRTGSMGPLPKMPDVPQGGMNN